MTKQQEAKAFIDLLDKIITITDVMYQAIKVDAFEIFESALDERAGYLETYQLEKAQYSNKMASEIELFISKMNELDVLVRQELERFDQKIHHEYMLTKRQKNQLIDGQRKTQRYTGDFQVGLSQSSFDLKK